MKLLNSNTALKGWLDSSGTQEQFVRKVEEWVDHRIEKSEAVSSFLQGDSSVYDLDYKDLGVVRIKDYIDNRNRTVQDTGAGNVGNEKVKIDPVGLIWRYYKGIEDVSEAFCKDMNHLFDQVEGRLKKTVPEKEEISVWMKRFRSGLDKDMIDARERNRERISEVIISWIEQGEKTSERFTFPENASFQEKKDIVLNRWWYNYTFHLHFAARNSKQLRDLMGESLDEMSFAVVREGEKKGIPVFANPNYVSLLGTGVPETEQVIKDTVLCNPQLVDTFGRIVAWEKEDITEPGKPNAAGWLLPLKKTVHRRYPEVAILIPETGGRACGGLCSYCQRMYEFQNGNLNFNLSKLKPRESWDERLKKVMDYFRNDTQLKDILITGGDALMSSINSLKQVLDAVYEMALLKREDNNRRPSNKKYAEMVRVRLGTRLLSYLPQKIDSEMISILSDFRDKGRSAGIEQFFIQTHFESPLEVTPEVADKVSALQKAGWIVTNQHVFIASASRRGHNAKLRETLVSAGIVPYYTFSVKGYKENNYHYSTIARLEQEKCEEKIFGFDGDIPKSFIREITQGQETVEGVFRRIEKESGSLFPGTDSSVMNLPGVGKSLTFRTIGILNDGRRVLEFDHNASRFHSPVIQKMGKVVIVESKPVSEYLDEIEAMGEGREDYESVYGYSAGLTERRARFYLYPEYDFKVTEELNNYSG